MTLETAVCLISWTWAKPITMVTSAFRVLGYARLKEAVQCINVAALKADVCASLSPRATLSGHAHTLKAVLGCFRLNGTRAAQLLCFFMVCTLFTNARFLSCMPSPASTSSSLSHILFFPVSPISLKLSSTIWPSIYHLSLPLLFRFFCPSLCFVWSNFLCLSPHWRYLALSRVSLLFHLSPSSVCVCVKVCVFKVGPLT